MVEKKGILYGVSVGTGDPELITLKGVKILENAPIVAFPQGIRGKKGIAEGIIEGYLNPRQKKVALCFPYTTDDFVLHQAWQKVAFEVYGYLMQGDDVAFACEGDVSFFSTFTYLAQYVRMLDAQVVIQRIPGVSSPMVAASALQIPLTMQEEKVAILPAFYSLEDLEKVLKTVDIVVLLKVHSVYSQVWQLLKNLDLLKFAQVVERASFSDEKIYTDLTNSPSLNLGYFSLMIICQR